MAGHDPRLPLPSLPVEWRSAPLHCRLAHPHNRQDARHLERLLDPLLRNSTEYQAAVTRGLQAEMAHLADAGHWFPYLLFNAGESEPMAVVTLSFGHTLSCGRFVEVVELVVAERYREQGVGRALMDAVRSLAQAEGYAGVHLSSRMMHVGRAHEFYKAIGFQEYAIHFKAHL